MLINLILYLFLGSRCGNYSHMRSKNKKVFTAMGMKFGTGIARCILCIMNMIFIVIGCLFLGLGLWLYINKDQMLAVLTFVVALVGSFEDVFKLTDPTLLDTVAYSMMGIGGVMILLSFIGCCGAWTKSTCLLNTYGLLLVIALILQIVLAMIFLIYNDKLKIEARKYLKKSLNKYNSENDDSVKLAWDGMMKTLHCCGVDSYKDFPENKIPDACCKPGKTCHGTKKSKNLIYRRGCYRSILNMPSTNILIIIAIAMVYLSLQILLIGLAFCLSRKLEQMCICYILARAFPP